MPARRYSQNAAALAPCPATGKHAPHRCIRIRPLTTLPEDDKALLARLKAGDQAAFRALVRARHAGLLRLAGAFLRNRASAEEVVQDTWVAVITSLDSYAGVAPLAAWINGILVNKARSRAVRDSRVLNFSDLARADAEADAPDPAQFEPDGHWGERFQPWDALTPEREAGDRELLAGVSAALDTLPPAQRAVVLLRDVEGLDSAEICRQLGISEANLRVLLHRARTKLRDAAARLAGPP